MPLSIATPALPIVTVRQECSQLLKHLAVEELFQRQLQCPHCQMGLELVNGTFNRVSSGFGSLMSAMDQGCSNTWLIGNIGSWEWYFEILPSILQKLGVLLMISTSKGLTNSWCQVKKVFWTSAPPGIYIIPSHLLTLLWHNLVTQHFVSTQEILQNTVTHWSLTWI